MSLISLDSYKAEVIQSSGAARYISIIIYLYCRVHTSHWSNASTSKVWRLCRWTESICHKRRESQLQSNGAWLALRQYTILGESRSFQNPEWFLVSHRYIKREYKFIEMSSCITAKTIEALQHVFVVHRTC